MLADIQDTTEVNGVPKLRVCFSDIDRDLHCIRECSQALEEIASTSNPANNQSVNRHQWNNVLNVATLTLDVLYYQLESGKAGIARQSLVKAKAAIREVENLINC